MTLVQPVISILLVLVAILGFGSCSSRHTATEAEQSSASPEYLGSNENRPFSEAVRVGSTLYLAGKLGTDSTGKLVSGGIAAETTQVMENIKAALEKNGSSLDRVVKCTVMLADIKDRDAMSSVYATYFKKGRMPARSAFGTGGLALEARVEIECVAVTN
jgi:2-iminobutanoate/2-iminopropanoate deaminase